HGTRSHLLDVFAAGISHGRTQSARKLMEYLHDTALVGHPSLDSFRHQLLELGGGVLEVSIGRAEALAHGAEGSHPAVGLVGSALVHLNFAGRLFRAGEQAADHDRMGARSEGLRDVARESNTAVRNDRHIRIAQRFSNIGYRRDLWNTD